MCCPDLGYNGYNYLLWRCVHHGDVVGGRGSALFFFGWPWWLAMALASVGSVGLVGCLRKGVVMCYKSGIMIWMCEVRSQLCATFFDT